MKTLRCSSACNQLGLSTKAKPPSRLLSLVCLLRFLFLLRTPSTVFTIRIRLRVTQTCSCYTQTMSNIPCVESFFRFCSVEVVTQALIALLDLSAMPIRILDACAWEVLAFRACATRKETLAYLRQRSNQPCRGRSGWIYRVKRKDSGP